MERILQAIKKGQQQKENLKHIMQELTEGKDIEKILAQKKADLSNLESEITNIIKEKPGLTLQGYMGIIMQKYKGKISGNDANQILKKILQ